jgi:hypothetical protein
MVKFVGDHEHACMHDFMMHLRDVLHIKEDKKE